MNPSFFNISAAPPGAADSFCQKVYDLKLMTGAPIHGIEVTRDGYTFDGWVYTTVDIYGEKTQHSYEIPRSMPNLELQKEEFGTAYENHVLSLEALWTVDLVTVSFDTDGGTEIASITGEAGAPLNNWPKETPTKEGYSFANYKYADGTTLLAPLTQFPTEDTTFTAVWTPYTYSYILKANGGTVRQAGSPTDITEITQEFGTDIAAVSARRPGFGFVEWYYVTENEWGEKTEHSYEIPPTMPAIENIEGAVVPGTGDVKATLTLNARWLGDAHTINYDYKGGTLPEGKTNPTSFEIGDTVKIAAPEKDGYDFAGWTIVYEDSGKDPVTTDESWTEFTAEAPRDDYDLTFTANYSVKKYTVTFDAAGGKWGSSVKAYREFEFGQVIDPNQFPVNPEYVPVGPYQANDWDFDAWEGYTEGMTMPAEDITFTAGWKLHEYKITYNYDPALEEGEEPNNPNPETFTVDEDVTFVDPSRDAYDFAGWGDSKLPSSKVSFKKGEFHQDLTMNSKWTAKTYTLTFDGNGGTWFGGEDDFGQQIRVPAIVKENVPYKTQISTELPNAPVRPGYAFEGWEGYKDTDTMPNEDMTYKAVWKAQVQTIYLHIFDGQDAVAIKAYTDAEITAPEDPVNKGYTFDGWYKDVGLTQKLESFPTTMPAGGMDLYAKWTLDVYTVTLDLAGGVFTNPAAKNPFTYSVTDENINVVEPFKTGYQFDGWTGEDLEEPTKDLVIAKGSVGDREYTANWTPFNYTVKFRNGNTGAFIKQIQCPYDSLIEKPSDPEMVGHHFIGWFSDAELKNAFDFTTTVLNEKILDNEGICTLYGKFEVNKYTVTFDSDGGTVIDPQVKEYNTLVTKPEDPRRDGYTFGGWYEVLEDGSLAPKAWNFKSSKVVDDTTLKAKWIGEPRRIFWMNGNELLSEETVYVGDPLVEFVPSPLPTRDGYMLDPDNLWDPEVPATVPAYKSNPQVYQLNWIKLNTVFFVRDGKVIQTVEVPMNQTLEGNPDVPVIPPKAGFKAVWMLDDEYFDLATPISEDKLTLVATYVQQYVVKFVNYDGTLLSSDLYELDETPVYTGVPAREATPEATYEFAGWTPAVAPVSADVTYTATYNETKNKYPITFKNGDTTLQFDELEYGATPEYKGETPTKAKTETNVYEFAGWDPEVVDVVSGATYKATYDTVPRWYDVTFENTEGADPEGQRVEYKDKATDPGAATTDKVGIEFVGWFEEGSTAAFDFDTPITEDKVLVAEWEAIVPEEYTVTFDAAGGEPVPDEQTVKEGEKAVKPATDPMKVGAEFIGWYNGDAEFDFSTPITGNLTLKAKYEPLVAEYKVTFINEEGANPDGQVVKSGEKAQDPGPATTDKLGIEFVGWFAEGSETAFDFNTPITANLTLTAKWNPVGESVIFENSLNLQERIGIRMKITIPEGAKAEDYTVNVSYTSPYQTVNDTMNLSTLPVIGGKYDFFPLYAGSDEMTYDLTVTVTKDGKEVGKKVVSVASIAEEKMQEERTQSDPKLMQIYKTLLQYGYYAQEQFGTHLDKLPTIPQGTTLSAIPSDYAVPDVEGFRISPGLDSAVTMWIKVKPAEGLTISDYTFKITKGNAVVNPDIAPSMVGGEIWVGVYLWSDFMNDDYVITVTAKGESATYTRCMDNALYNYQASGTAVQIAQALYTYSEAVDAYFNA